MSTSITTFPFSADKISELPVVTSLLPVDKIVATASGVTSAITKTNFIADLDFQPHDTTLDSLAAINLSLVGQALLAVPTPDTGTNQYFKVNEFNSVSLLSPSAVRSDIAAQPLNSNLTIYSAITPSNSGRGILRTVPPEDVPGYLRVEPTVDSYSIATVRTYAQVRSDIGAFAQASLDNDATLGGLLTNSTKAPSQQAVKKYVDSKIGIKLDPALNDDTIASAATMDLDATDGGQIRVTGTIPVTAITLSTQKTLVFDGAVTFAAGPDLTLPGGAATLTTEAGGYATVIGSDISTLVEITQYFSPNFQIHYGGDFYTAAAFTAGGTVSLGTDLITSGAFTTTGIYSITLNVPTGNANITLPNGTYTLLPRDSMQSTVTGAGTTTLLSVSKYQQFFTGSTTQTVTLPVASTLTVGYSFRIINRSSGNITVQSSGGNTVATMTTDTAKIFTCILNSGTSAASWDAI